MCGLVFLFHPGEHADVLRKRGEGALQRIVHRGPDERGLVVETPWLVGHQRLSIVDLGSSHQPMNSADGRYLLAYNGEVYNYRELRAQLESEWRFHTDGDTEVVLAGLVRHGPGFIASMEGMWALCLWDRQTKSLLLSRDRMGKKPLYYQAEHGGFAVASELPALAALGIAPFTEDRDSTADYLRHGFFLPGTTAYHGVMEVHAGHFLEWRPGETPRQTAYWQIDTRAFTGSHADARAQLHDKLTAAVRKRMVADVEVGAFLSGGIDSSLVVSLLARDLGISPKTFSIGFKEASYDERDYARLIARQYGTDHYEECLSDWGQERLTTLILQHVGQPFFDASLLPTAIVSELASRHVKVALSGDGADELFSGYQRYQARILMRWYTRLPRPVRAAADRLVRVLPEPMAHHSRSLLKKAHLFLDAVERYEDETPYTVPRLYTRQEFGELAPELGNCGHTPPGLPEQCRPDDIVQMMCADAMIYLPQDILLKVDRASMAHSLEARAPFLDREVVELALSLPGKWHRRRFAGKWMIKETFRDYLPAAIWKRRKQGFSVPLHSWFRGRLGDELVELCRQDTGPVAVSHIRQLLQEHRRKVRDNSYRLWSIYIYLLFRNTYKPAVQTRL
jgi:asparagine synthase (glutamine-hydrolysing)